MADTIAQARAELATLKARVEGAKALHFRYDGNGEACCNECLEPFPCPTLRALEGGEG